MKGNATAIALLEGQRATYVEKLRLLKNQMAGVERAINAAEARIEAVDEALAALSPQEVEKQ